MVFILSFKITFLGCSVASALVLNLTSSISSQQALSTKTVSVLSDYLTSGDRLSVLTFEADCNGAESGIGLTKENCQDAVHHGIPDVIERAIISYGDRSFGKFDVNLPQRYISGKEHSQDWKYTILTTVTLGDGRCLIDITLDDIHKITPYYPFGIALAASYLQARCVTERSPAEGGTMQGFGRCPYPGPCFMVR